MDFHSADLQKCVKETSFSQRRAFFCDKMYQTLRGVGDEDCGIDEKAVDNDGIEAQTLENMSAKQRLHCPCTAAAGTGETGDGVKETGRKKAGRVTGGELIQERQEDKERERKQTVIVDALFPRAFFKKKHTIPHFRATCREKAIRNCAGSF